MESRCEVNSRGTKNWYNKKGELHRKNGPAVVWPDGSEEYWVDGEFVKAKIKKPCWLNGQLVNLGGPAIF